MHFYDLNEHVLAELLSYCDVYGVLCFTRVNKFCRQIALSKQLWIILVSDLESRGLRDADPNEELQLCTQGDLVDMVKRVVVGPTTWSPTCSTGPKLQREVVVRFDKPIGSRASVRLLPGGKYFVLYDSWDNSGIWEVSTGRCIWTHPHRIRSWVVDTICDTHLAFVICRAYSASYERAVQIIQVDLLTGHSNDAFYLPLPSDVYDISDPILLGNFFVMSLRTDHTSPVSGLLLIVDWRAQKYALVESPPSLTVVLFRRHIPRIY
ncbi:hypothetical protein B0H11DRAFT_1331946 [Mycena galericulata]|nr:hypothetical protein B0H11DRAFT_1331946 [Mycena galericulata]